MSYSNFNLKHFFHAICVCIKKFDQVRHIGLKILNIYN